MASPEACCVVLITAPSEEEAAVIAKGLVQEGLVACCNIVKGIHSIYMWEGKARC